MIYKDLSNSIKIRFFSFYLSFSVVGLLLAYWFGFGWFILFITLRRAIMTIPEIYIPIVHNVVGQEFSQIEKAHIYQKKINSRKIITIILWIMLVFFGFWKINIPIRDMISVIGNNLH